MTLVAAFALLGSADAASGADWMLALEPPFGSPVQLRAWTASIDALQDDVLGCVDPDAVLRRYEAVPLLYVRLSPAALARAEQCEGVAAITRNGRYVPFLTQSLPLVELPTVQSTYGYTGAGSAVAVLDTGADSTHASLSGRIAVSYDFADADADVSDCHGHGTNVAAIVAGVAPSAELLVYKVFPSADCQSATDESIAAALDDVVLQTATRSVASVNLSLGTDDFRTSTSCSGTGTATETAINTVWTADVVVVAAAGNDGDGDNLSFPACLPHALAVGNTYDAAASSSSWCLDRSCTSYCTDSSPAADTFNCSSNSGELLDLVAPGSTIDAGGQSMGGTSQASPHVAGAVAILREAAPGSEPRDLEDWLLRSATFVTDTRNGLSYPRLDLATMLLGSVDDLKITEVSLQGSDPMAGEVAVIRVTVENEGPGDVEDVTVTLTATDPDLLPTGEAVPFGTIARGGSATVLLNLPVSPDCLSDHEVRITATAANPTGSGDDKFEEFDLHCFQDADGDGIEARSDCNDDDPAILPGAPELCNELDDDCDGEVDGANAVDPSTWYEDADGDLFGNIGSTASACAPPPGFLQDSSDCNDSDARVYPGALETCADDLDLDCSGIPADNLAPGEDCTPPKAEEPGGCGCSGGPEALGGFAMVAGLALAALRRR